MDSLLSEAALLVRDRDTIKRWRDWSIFCGMNGVRGMKEIASLLSAVIMETPEQLSARITEISFEVRGDWQDAYRKYRKFCPPCFTQPKLRAPPPVTGEGE